MTDRDAQESFIRKGAEAMTDEELKYLKALKSEIDKRMGSWRLGDPYWCPRQEEFGFGGNHIKFITYDINEDLQITPETTPCCPDVAIHVPLAIDPENRERGLWGMVNWEESVASIASNGFLIVQKYPWIKGNFICCESPYLALLKTLVHQWNVKVK